MNIKYKNLIRAYIGFFTTLLIFKKRTGTKIYCNLKGGAISGGPDRFLKSITTSTQFKNIVSLSNWSLSGCHSALVFSSSWGNSFTFLCKLLRIKSVLRVDGFYVPDDKVDESFQQSHGFRKWTNNRLAKDLQRFDHIIYQSDFSKKICDQYLFKRNNNYSIIYNGTNIRKFDIGVRKNKKIQLILLGKHYPKHLKLSIDIIRHIKDELDVELLIIGPMRNGEDIVEDFISSMGIEEEVLEKIRCLGIKPYEQLPDLIRNADIFLHVKVGDWCPNAVLEAMACGLPVVCPEWGGTSELVGDAGISVPGPEWDVNNELIKGMAQGVLTISKNLSEYKLKARTRVRDHFDIENISKNYMKVLEIKIQD